MKTNQNYNNFLFGFSLFFIWILVHPYNGIWHDARIYSLIAVRETGFSGYENDLFFLFGSQGDFSVFTYVFSWFVGFFGVDNSNKFFYFLGGGIVCFSYLFLIRSVTNSRAALFIIAAALVFSSISYSPFMGIFKLNENFVTPRLFSIALSFFSISKLIKGDGFYQGFFISVLAFLIHPLFGCWAVAIFLYYWDGRLAALSTIIFLFFASSFSDVMADDWFQGIAGTNSDVVLSGFPNTYIKCFIALAFSCFCLKQKRRAVMSLLVVSLGGVLVSLYSANYYRNHFLIELQTWRVMAVAIPLSIVLSFSVFFNNRYSFFKKITFTLGGFSFILAGDYEFLVYAILLVIVFFDVMKQRLSRRLLGFFENLILSFFAISVSYYLYFDFDFVFGGGFCLNLFGCGFFDCLFIAACFVTFFCFYLYLESLSYLFFSLVFFVFLFSYSWWDVRGVDKELREGFYGVANYNSGFSDYYKSSTIYWPGHEMDVWFVLGGSNYFSGVQGAGRVFNQRRFAEFSRRANLVYFGKSVENVICRDSGIDYFVDETAGHGYSDVLFFLGRKFYIKSRKDLC